MNVDKEKSLSDSSDTSEVTVEEENIIIDISALFGESIDDQNACESDSESIDMTSKDFSVEKLKGSENFHEWAFAMESYLAIKSYGDCIVADTTDTNAAKEKDAVKLAQAKGVLVLSIETSLYPHIRLCKSAIEIWKKIHNLFEDRGLMRRIGLLEKLVTNKLEDCESMTTYIGNIMSSANKLRSIGFDVTDDWLISIMLVGLPNEFKPYIMSLESATNVTADDVKLKLLDMGSGETSNAFAAKGKKQKKKKKFTKRKCYTCDSTEHLANACPQKVDKKKEKKANEETKAFFALSAFSKERETQVEDDNTNVRGSALFVKPRDVWHLDSGASNHMSHDDYGMQNCRASNINEILGADNSCMPVQKCGNLILEINENEINVDEVLHIPKLAVNLLSVYKITQRGNIVTFDSDGCVVKTKKGEILAFCKPNDGVYRIKIPRGKCYATREKVDDDAYKWHRRLGHINVSSLVKMRDGIVDGIKFREIGEAIANCARAKLSRSPFPHSSSRSKELLELIHSDLMGPFETKSIGHARYALTFIDNFSRKVFVYFLSQKNQTFKTFKEFKSLIENQSGKRVKCLRSDGGGEYASAAFGEFLRSNGIIHQKTAPHTPEQNGLAERMNRTLVERTKCLLFDANLPKTYWAEAMSMAAYLINRSACAALDKQTPEEVFMGKKVDLSNLKTFGCTVMVHIPKANRRKLDAKANKMIFVGFDANTKGYRCIDTGSRKLTISRDVKFIEDSTNIFVSVDEPTVDEPNDNDDPTNASVADDEIENDDEPQINNQPSPTNDDHNSSSDSDAFVEAQSTSNDHQNTDPDFQTRAKSPEGGRQPSSRLKTQFRPFQIPTAPRANAKYALFTEPTSYGQAKKSDERNKWQQAMQEEMDAHQLNQTWTLCDLPNDRRAIKSKWVFKIKGNSNKNIRFKARLVAKGYAQREGIDYDETFSPVVRHSSLRILFALAVQGGMKIHQMDAICAFLQGDLNEIIFMEQPEGFDDNSKRVCRLNKSIYGLKQAGRCWNLKLDRALKDFKFNQSPCDPCVYFNAKVIIALYVDDFLIFYKNDDDLICVKEYLNNKFDMKDIGIATECIGMRIEQSGGHISIDQEEYINHLVAKYELQNCKPAKTPSDTAEKLSVQMVNDENDITGTVPYQELIGSLLYISQCTRPDIAFSVNNASRFNSRHCKTHWEAVLRILKYLSGTADYKLKYSGPREDLCAFSDADWASDIDKRRSCTGSLLKLAGAAISWQSKRQDIVAMSSTEAEYIAMSSTVREVEWTKQFINGLQPNAIKTVTIYCDNESAIKLGNIAAFRERTKHIDIRHHHIREKVERNEIRLRHVGTNNMIADSLTKPVTGEKTKFCAQGMGISQQ